MSKPTNSKRRRREDRGRDHSVEVDLTLDAIERIETALTDILDLLRDIKKQVTPVD